MNWDAVLGTLIIVACLVLLGLSVRQAIRAHRSRQMSDETALAMIASVTVTKANIAVISMASPESWSDAKRDVADKVAESLEHTQVLLHLTSDGAEQNRFFDGYMRAGIEEYSDETRDGLVAMLKGGVPTATVNEYLEAARGLPLAFESLRGNVSLEYVRAVAPEVDSDSR